MYGGRCRDHAVLPEVFLPKVLAHMTARTNKAGTKNRTPTHWKDDSWPSGNPESTVSYDPS